MRWSTNSRKLQPGRIPPKWKKDTYQEATRALQKKDYALARGLFQRVVGMKIPDSTLAPKAQTELGDLDQLIQAKAEFDAADGTQKRGDLKGAVAQYEKIAAKPGPYAAEAKARIPKLTDMINHAGDQQAFTAAVQAQNSGNMQSAMDQFKSIAGKPGPFRDEAKATHSGDYRPIRETRFG